MQNVVFEIHRVEPIGNIARLTEKARESLNALRCETGLPATTIIQIALQYAADHHETREV